MARGEAQEMGLWGLKAALAKVMEFEKSAPHKRELQLAFQLVFQQACLHHGHKPQCPRCNPALRHSWGTH